MNQPLGWAVGNSIEVREAIATLHGAGPEDFREHCWQIAAEMLYLGGKAESVEAGVTLAKETVASGAAWEKFRALITAQEGDLRYIDEPERLPTAEIIEPVRAERAGYVASTQANEIGLAVVALGGGREKKGAPIDHAVGVTMHVKVGDHVEAGEPLFTVHANDEEKYEAAAQRVRAAIALSYGFFW
jgi:pyrimidine-nucleoside phosphorylase